MLVRTGSQFRVEDYFQERDTLTIVTNIVPDFNILRQCKTLEIKPMIKTAKVIKVAPKQSDFLYIRNRAVSAGNVIEKDPQHAEVIPIEEYYKNFDKYAFVCRNANQNGDFFSHEELMNSYKTFIGKATFVDHNNENVENARGIILDAVYNEDGKYVELLKAVDKKAYPELARAIEKSYVTSTSMGCRCEYSICSICGNKAQLEEDFCDHIKNYKGSTFNGYPVFEDNRGVEFFEDSFVTLGADKDAKILEKVAGLNSHTRILPHQHKSPVSDLVRNEKNQRSYYGRINTLQNKLENLPWS